MPAAWKTGLVSSGLSVTQLAMIGALVLMVLDAGVLSLAMVRFKRARSIAVVIALVLRPSPSTAQTTIGKISSTNDSLLSCASRTTTFEVTGLSNRDVPPPKSLTALADSIRLGCRGRL